MRESKNEGNLDKDVKKAGGRTYKWVGRKGVPDRIVLMPIENEEHRRIVAKYVRLVETKGDGGVEPIQEYIHRQLKKLGHVVTVLWCKEQINELIEEMKK